MFSGDVLATRGSSDFMNAGAGLENSGYDTDMIKMVKALGETGAAGVDMSALIGESLDDMITRAVLESPRHTPFSSRVKRVTGKAIQEEWNVLTSLGAANRGFCFFASGGLPPEDASKYSRSVATMAYAGGTRIITGPALAASEFKFGDLKARELVNATQKLTLDLDYNYFNSSTAVNPLGMRGFIDTPGAILRDHAAYSEDGLSIVAGGDHKFEQISSAASQIADNFGEMTAHYCSLERKTALDNTLQDKMRYTMGAGQPDQGGVSTGIVATRMITTGAGALDCIWTPACDAKKLPRDPSNAALFHASAPALLQNAISPAPASGGYLPPGLVFYYGVSQVNGNDEGPIQILNSGMTTTTTNKKVNVTITRNSVLQGRGTMYRIYRSTTAAPTYANMRFVGEVAADYSASTQVWTDTGAYIPGSTIAVSLNERHVEVASLRPLTTYELAKTGDTFRFMVLTYQLLKCKVPSQIIVHKNLGGSVSDPAATNSDYTQSEIA